MSIIELVPNGDIYCRGFSGRQSDDGVRWYYRGDIGPRPRSWWRTFCRKNGYRLREYRDPNAIPNRSK